MPTYTFQHPNTEEIIDVIQGMNDDHVYIDENGTEWNRVWSCPQINAEAEIDPWSKSDFMEKTKNSKGNMGDLLDRSKEMSEARAKEYGGEDPIRNKYFKNYSKERMGAKHPEQKKTYEDHQIKVEY
tara:strand:+ start:38 stop:418 length:381 start_codon:yes stop_codon:yes gene_type:complete